MCFVYRELSNSGFLCKGRMYIYSKVIFWVYIVFYILKKLCVNHVIEQGITLFTFGLCIQENHQLLTCVYSEQNVMVDHLQSGGMPMASLHKPATLAYSWP